MTTFDATGLKPGNIALQFSQQEIQIICLALTRHHEYLLGMTKKARKIGFDDEANKFADSYKQTAELVFSIENQERNL